MSTSADPLHRLVQVAKLEAISFLELSASKSGRPGADFDVPSPEFELEIDLDSAIRRFRVHFRVSAKSEDVAIAVEPIAEYSVPEEDQDLLDLRVLLEYANEVALMSLIPYAREAIADITRKVLGSVVLLPILRRGELAFDMPAEDDAGHLVHAQ